MQAIQGAAEKNSVSVMLTVLHKDYSNGSRYAFPLYTKIMFSTPPTKFFNFFYGLTLQKCILQALILQYIYDRKIS